MYYTFSNTEKLRQLVEQKRLREIVEEFSKAKIIILDTYKGVALSAGVMYNMICAKFSSEKEALPKSISEHAINLFVETWDVESLKSINSSHGNSGKLNKKAIQVLDEYERYRVIAIDKFNSLSKNGSFETEITDTEDGIPVIIKYSAGRLSLFRKNKEYVIYYGDDFY